MRISLRLRAGMSTLSLASVLLHGAPPAVAQSGTPAAPAEGQSTDRERSGSDALLAEIVVTGTKQNKGQLNQSVPVAITAFGAEQIEALKIGDFTQIASQVPGVSFEQVTARSTVNLSIRGLGVNSSRASTAPAVGVFVNGVYMGVNSGIFFDTFDVEGIEVLRGPQGTLFGRNVTGGAVLLNYRKPQSDPDLQARARVESGPAFNLAIAGGGAISENVSARLAAFYDRDLGYFDAPVFGDNHYGESTSVVVRPSIRFDDGSTDVTLFGEYGRVSGDGPVHLAVQYRGGLSPTLPGTAPEPGLNYNDVLQQFGGDTYIKWYSTTLEAHQDVGFGEDAAITSITGYRSIENYSASDFDGTPISVSNSSIYTRQRQFSEELRYNGSFGIATVTTGLYYYHQRVRQLLKNLLANATQGGGVTENVYGVFGQVDFKLSDPLTLQLGGRYTHERKDAGVASLASEDPNVIQPGTNGVPGSCVSGDRNGPQHCDYTFRQRTSFSNFSPKISLQYQAANALFYATAQKAYRSGGTNLIQNSVALAPAFEPERQTVYEIGFKSDLFGRATRLNGAAYITKIKDLQRDTVISFVPPGGLTALATTTTANPADATIKGFELELVQRLLPGLVLTGSVSHTHARYDAIRLDITQDPASEGGPMVTEYDYRQRLPRVLPWTYGLALNGDHDFAFGRLSFRASWNHRDGSFFPDYNTDRRDTAVPKLPAADLFDLAFTFEPADTNLQFTLYGKNLANEMTFGNFTPIAYPNLRGCACFVNKGRVLGAEVSAGF